MVNVHGHERLPGRHGRRGGSGRGGTAAAADIWSKLRPNFYWPRLRRKLVGSH